MTNISVSIPDTEALLYLQGGPMNADEVEDFAKHPNLEATLQGRIWDDEGKVKNMPTPAFEHYAPRLQRVVDAQVVGAP